MQLKDVLEQFKSRQKTASEAPVNDPIKTAADLGVRDAENLVKAASFMGTVMGEAFLQTVQSGFEEMQKEAALQEEMLREYTKIAEQVGGTTASGVAAADQAEQLQLAESAAHHANLAVQASHDAVQSLSQGDEHTATQALSTAASAITKAKEFAAQTAIQEVHAHVEEAAGIVAEAAGMAESHATGV